MWYQLNDPRDVASPCVLVYRDRVIRNIESAILLAGGPDQLRPHVKTHKSADVVRLHLKRGVTRFKCATVAEATMLAQAGAQDILLAYQPVGPVVDHLCQLARKHSRVRFGCLLDNEATLGTLETLCEHTGVVLFAYVDLDVGMHRTGIQPGSAADALYSRIAQSRWIEAGGIHAYDGHILDGDREVRRESARESRDKALMMRARLTGLQLAVPEVVLGGTPAFGCHAEAVVGGITFSPGTYVYSDWGHGSGYPDLPFEAAAVVLGRVISVPTPGRFTIDVGSKAIAADPTPPRGMLLNYPNAIGGNQSEELWVFTVGEGDSPSVGMPVYVWPRHICPTIEHYDDVVVVEDGRVVDRWPVTARGRALK